MLWNLSSALSVPNAGRALLVPRDNAAEAVLVDRGRERYTPYGVVVIRSAATKSRVARRLDAAGPCGRTRRQMSSCKEAMYYMKDVDLYRLDNDKDGIPCEKLCR